MKKSEIVKSRTLLHSLLRPHLVSENLSLLVHRSNGRVVTIKHRFRRDRQAVVSLGCWRQNDDGLFEPVVFTTTLLPTNTKDCRYLGRMLCWWLENGGDISLAKYPAARGCEEFDSNVLRGEPIPMPTMAS